MSIRRVAAGDAIEVTFRVPATVDAHEICVVGEFNGWSRTANPMERTQDGWVASLVLERGRTHRFRYLLDDDRWANDWEADAYEPNGYGGDDSVIDLTDKTTSPS